MNNENIRYQYFQKPFIDLLNEKVDNSLLLDEEKMISKSNNLVELNKSLIQDQPSLDHLHTTSLIIVSYRTLKKIYAEEKVLEIIRYAFVDSWSHITKKTEQFLNESRNPFKDMVEVSKQKEKEYGETFTFYKKQDDDNAYLLEVKNCFYCKVLKLNKAEKLMPIFCDFDTVWMNAINPKKHQFKFDRPETIGTGGDICKFYFTRVNSKQNGI